jgi:hypothetical protein
MVRCNDRPSLIECGCTSRLDINLVGGIACLASQVESVKEEGSMASIRETIEREVKGCRRALDGSEGAGVVV